MNKSTSRIVKTGLGVAGGFAAAQILGRQQFLAANPTLKILAPVGLAILAPKFLGKSGSSVAAGMVASAAIDAVKTYAPAAAQQIGLAGPVVPFRSLQLPGVAGVGAMPQTQARERVKVVMQ